MAAQDNNNCCENIILFQSLFDVFDITSTRFVYLIQCRLLTFVNLLSHLWIYDMQLSSDQQNTTVGAVILQNTSQQSLSEYFDCVR